MLPAVLTSSPSLLAPDIGYLPPHALEEYALAEELGGGYYDPQVAEVIPKDIAAVNRLFTCAKTYLSQQIGEIFPRWKKWQGLNSATTPKMLLKDAKAAAPKFIAATTKIAQECGVQAHFGPNMRYALKTEGSLRRKIASDSQIEQISQESATQKLGDALRGTLIVSTPEQARSITEKINQWIQQEGGKIAWKNLFQEPDRKDGYIGIHGKILLPFTNHKGESRQILSELQIHFSSIVDGSLDSPKERMHLLYKNLNTNLSSWASQGVSKLSFLSGLASINNLCRIPSYLKSLCSRTLNLCADPNFSELCDHNLGIPRIQMPQLDHETTHSFLNQTALQGTRIEESFLPADQLTSTQAEINRDRVSALMSANPCSMRILIASNNKNGKRYIVDGHHHYAACRLLDGKQSVIAIEDSIENILERLKSFPGVESHAF